MTSPGLLHGLILGAIAVVGLQVLVAVAMMARAYWADVQVRKTAVRGRILGDLLEQIETEPSLHVRRQLADAQLSEDIEALDRWLDLVAERGDDPAHLEPEVYEDAGLVNRYIEQLRFDRRWTRRAAAAGILGWTGSPRAVRPLLECAQDIAGESPKVRAVALRALGRIRHPDVVEELVDSLGSSETWLPPVVASMLARIGPAALDPLVERLDDIEAPAASRRWAAQILGDIRHRRALPALLRALSDPDAEIRARSARALATLGDERAVDRLLDRLLVDPIPFVRTAVAKALGALGSERTLQFLVESLADPEWWVRLRAVEALEQMGSQARDVLIASLSDPDPQVAREAARALEGIGAVAEAIRQLLDEGYAASASEFLIDIGRTGNLEPLLDELESEDEEHLRSIVRILARIGDLRAGRELAGLLDRVISPSLRARIVDALRRVGDGTHVARVLPMLEDSNEWLRKTAVDYVADFGGPEAVDHVLPLVHDPNPWTRESALRVLQRLAPPEADSPSVRDRLNDEHDFVCAQAIRTLCAVRAFDALLESDILWRIAEDRLREALLEGLRGSATVKAMPLLTRLAAFCADDDLFVLQRAASRAVGALETSEVDLLLFGYADPNQESSSRWFAAVGWAGASEEVAETWRDELVNDPDPRVRAAMFTSLGDRDVDRTELVLALHQGLGDDAPLVVRAAISTVARRQVHELDASVRDLLRHEDEDVRVDAILALALLPKPERRFGVEAKVFDRGRPNRLASTMGRLLAGEPDALVEWITALGDDEDRELLERWIERDHPMVHQILDHAADSHELAHRILCCRSTFEAERILVEELVTNHLEESRLLALRGASALRSDRCAGRILSAFLKDQSPRVRAEALVYLAEHDAFGRRRQYLEQAFRDPEDALRIRAAMLSVLLPKDLALELLAEQLATRRGLVLRTVTDMLAGLIEDDPEGAMDVILGLPPDVDRYVGLVHVLGKTVAPISNELLDLFFRHRWVRVRATALHVLLDRLGEEGWDVVERALGDPSPRVRAQAVRSLAESKNTGLRKNQRRLKEAILRAHVDPNPEVRSRTALALAGVDFRGSATILKTLERDDDKRVVRVAQRVRQMRRARRRRQHASRPEEVSS